MFCGAEFSDIGTQVLIGLDVLLHAYFSKRLVFIKNLDNALIIGNVHAIIAPIMEREQEYMPDYKKMYFSLLNTVSSTIEHLQAAQCNMENEYIEHAEPLLHIVSDSKEEKTKAAE